MVAQGRNFCFTLNNYAAADEAELQLLSTKYLVYGREVAPSTGTHHLQGYVIFTSNKRLPALQRICDGRISWRNARGSAQQNRDYCTKEGNFVETGSLPKTKETIGEEERKRWKAAYTAAKSGNFEEIPEDILIRYYGSLRRIEKDHLKPKRPLLETCGIWLYGEPGVGKSHAVFKGTTLGSPEETGSLRQNTVRPGEEVLRIDLYDKGLNKWWDGYQNQKFVLVDDISLNHDFLGYFLKRWADKWPFIAEVKGGSIWIRPNLVIVTSNYKIEDIWKDDLPLQAALNRRFKFIEVTRENRSLLNFVPVDEE